MSHLKVGVFLLGYFHKCHIKWIWSHLPEARGTGGGGPGGFIAAVPDGRPSFLSWLSIHCLYPCLPEPRHTRTKCHRAVGEAWRLLTEARACVYLIDLELACPWFCECVLFQDPFLTQMSQLSPYGSKNFVFKEQNKTLMQLWLWKSGTEENLHWKTGHLSQDREAYQDTVSAASPWNSVVIFHQWSLEKSSGLAWASIRMRYGGWRGYGAGKKEIWGAVQALCRLFYYLCLWISFPRLL